MSDLYDPHGRDLRRYVDEDGKSRLVASSEVCDFCMSPEPCWEYPAGYMPIVGHPQIDASDDAWAACEECHLLLKAHNLGGLVERQLAAAQDVAARDPRVVTPSASIVRSVARENLLAFMDARTGPPVPLRRAEP